MLDRSIPPFRIVLLGLVLGVANNSANANAQEFDWKQTSEFLQTHCSDCHVGDEPAGEFHLPDLSWKAASAPARKQLAQLERILRRVAAFQMPPKDVSEVDAIMRLSFLTHLTPQLDQLAEEHPEPGRTDSIRRLNRTEYQNAVRDLLHLELNVKDLLPADQSGHGFDNVTVGELSPVLLSRYISSAEKIARAAVGRATEVPVGFNLRLPPDRTQDRHIEGLPLGTRGGTQFEYHFPASGEFEIQLRLMRDRDENVEGLNKASDVDFLLDGQRVHRLRIEAPKRTGANWQRDDTLVDAHLKKRFQTTGGPHTVTVTFPATNFSLLENRRQPFQPSFNRHRHPRLEPAIFEVSIVGPFPSDGGELPSNAPDSTPSRARIFRTYPSNAEDAEEALRCATEILERLLTLAYRRPIDAADLDVPLQLFRQRFEADGFEPAMETAISAILVNPHFLFRAERDPVGAQVGEAYQISDIELASRLSFFLWSSLPDEELLELAAEGQLRKGSNLTRQVTRMLQDSRSSALVNNFASQWLYLRNLDSFKPDLRLFPDFDDNLREAMRRETELHVERMLREDRSVLDLIESDTTFVNDRLAQHYGLPHVAGSHFREVEVGAAPRGGLLRQASILSVTSYATRTSPTVRGNWVLENILGTPPPPPPPNIPSLKEKTESGETTVRQRLAQHRENPACASCHDLIDPIGFALENFDAVGRWRSYEGESLIDNSGALPNGASADGVVQLEAGIMEQPDLFVSTLTEKLLTFALGRGITAHDAPAIRKIVRNSADDHYRFSAIVQGIVESVPFQMRTAAGRDTIE